MFIATAAAAWFVVGGIPPAFAQSGQRATPPQPRVIVVPNDIYRPPPAPPERYIAPPRSGQQISPSMPRPEPLPQMSPRIGN